MAIIAQNILSISASDTDIEQLFNCIRDICYYRCGYLKPDTIRNLILYQFATTFDIQQQEIEIVKKYLSTGETVLFDQVQKSIVQFESLEPISNCKKENKISSSENIQQIEDRVLDRSSDTENHYSDLTQSRQSKYQLSRKRPADVVNKNNDLSEIPIQSTQGRSGRVRKLPKISAEFEIIK